MGVSPTAKADAILQAAFDDITYKIAVSAEALDTLNRAKKAVLAEAITDDELNVLVSRAQACVSIAADLVNQASVELDTRRAELNRVTIAKNEALAQKAEANRLEQQRRSDIALLATLNPAAAAAAMGSVLTNSIAATSPLATPVTTIDSDLY